MSNRSVGKKHEANGGNPFAGVAYRGVDSETWGDLVRLFMAPGGPKYCWCMVWRTMPPGVSHSDRDAKRTALESHVRGGTPIRHSGLLERRSRRVVLRCTA